jgi:hypothetical protein
MSISDAIYRPFETWIRPLDIPYRPLPDKSRLAVLLHLISMFRGALIAMALTSMAGSQPYNHLGSFGDCRWGDDAGRRALCRAQVLAARSARLSDLSRPAGVLLHHQYSQFAHDWHLRANCHSMAGA